MTVAVLVPNEDIFWLPYEVEPLSSTAWMNLSDSDDVTAVLVGEWIFAFTTFTIPPAGIVRSIQVATRGYNRTNDAGAPVTMFINATDALGAVLASFTLSYPWLASPSTAASDRITATSAVVADQALIDGIRVHMWHHFAYGDEDKVVLTKLSVNVVYAAIPVVVVGDPSGTILTSSPVLSWTYSGDPDADGGGVQQRYHIKVFDAATYGAVGFDPADSPAAYDSGEVVSNTTSAIIGPLVNVTTFKAYMRVAQNVNGAPHWSLWDDGPEFTTDTDPPQVATISAVVSGAAIKVRVTRDLAHTDWTHVNVERSVDAGVTWRPVRGGLAVAAPDDTVVVYDYEHPEGVPLRYRARGQIKSGALVLSQGDWKATTSPITWTTEDCGEWLRAPGDPAGAMFIEVIVDEATTTTRHRIGVLDVIGRESPVTVWDVPLLPVGVLSTVTRTYADGVALRELVRTAPVLLWQGRRAWGHPHRWMVIVDHSVSRHPSADSMFTEYRQWEISWVEVAEPPVLS